MSQNKQKNCTHLADSEDGADDHANEEHEQETSVKGGMSLGVEDRKKYDACRSDDTAEDSEVRKRGFASAHGGYQAVARHKNNINVTVHPPNSK